MRTRLATLKASTATRIGGDRIFGVEFLGFLAGRNPHDLDGIADHAGGPLLASEPARRQRPSISAVKLPVLRSKLVNRITIGPGKHSAMDGG